MTRVLAVVEGRSEELFLRRAIVPHLAEQNVFLEPMQVLRGGGARGGGSSWQPWRNHLSKLLKSQPADTRFTMMIDLYAIPKDIPGWSQPSWLGGPPGAERADQILSAIAVQMSTSRFIPYIQVHEFESLLLVDPRQLVEIAPENIDHAAMDALVAEVSASAPEAIDDGPTTAPSKRIERVCVGFSKIELGVQAVTRIPLPTLRSACPRFHAWITQLEALGEGEGEP